MGIHLCICFLTGPLEVPVEAKKDLEQKVVGDEPQPGASVIVMMIRGASL